MDFADHRNLWRPVQYVPARHYMPYLYEEIKNGDLDPTKIITHTMPLEESALGYRIFQNKEDNCIKVVLKP
ncbi:hypothetical protein [Ammoniphilus oxalaticus]